MTPFPPPPEPRDAPSPEAEIQALLDGNRSWVDALERDDPETFPELARRHRPPFMLVGCCDARMPMDLMTSATPGHLFLHRNVANQIRPDDPAIRASLDFGLGVLGARHLIVCGHTGCGGVQAAFSGGGPASVQGWVNPIHRLAQAESLKDADELAERNVIFQLEQALEFEAVQEGLRDPDRVLVLHGWIFRLETGRIEVLPLPVDRWRSEGRF